MKRKPTPAEIARNVWIDATAQQMGAAVHHILFPFEEQDMQIQQENWVRTLAACRAAVAHFLEHGDKP